MTAPHSGAAPAVVRPARPGDAEAIVAILNPIIAETTITFASTLRDTAGLVAQISARRGAAFVAMRDDQVAGYATYAPLRGGTGYLRTMEHTIALAACARGQGIGRALFTALEAHAAAAGHRSLVAAISGENPAAIAFHAAMGFAEVGRVADAGWKFGRWIDLVMMQKMLATSA